MRGLQNLLLFFLFFPFVTPVKLGFDSQPWAFLVALVLLFIYSFSGRIRLPFIALWFFFSILYGVASVPLNLYRFGQVDVFSLFRSLFSVVGLPVCLIAFISSRFELQRLAAFLRFAVYTYFIVGLVQIFMPSFLTFIIARASTSEARGVYSLAPEPVEYARTCILMFIMLCLFRISSAVDAIQFRRLSLLLLVQALVFSLSGTAFVWLVFLGLIYLFNSGISKFKLLFFGLLTLLLGYAVVQVGLTYFPEKRVFYLINVAMENPQLLTKFGGFTLRLLNPIHSTYVGIFMFDTLGVGFGFKGIEQIVNYAFLGDFFADVSIEISGRSHGGLVSLIYELGIFALPFLIAFIGIAYRMGGYKKYKLSYHFIFYSFLLMVAFDGPLSNAMLALVLGIFHLCKQQLRQQTVLH